MPEAIIQPTVTIRVYDASQPGGVRRADLSFYRSATFTRQRNAIGTFEIQIPLIPANLALMNEVREGWLFEFWAEAPTPSYMFGGFVNLMRWALEAGQTILTVRGLSYLAWISQRRIIGGTGMLGWSTTLTGLETASYKPPINQIMYHAMTYGGGQSPPLGLCPPGTPRAHPLFQIPDNENISHITDAWSYPTLPLNYGLPRLTNTEITAFLSGIEVMNYLTERVGDRANHETGSVWFGMPRVSYDIIRYDGPPYGVWPSGALYFIIRAPSLGINRTVGNTLYDPVIFDVDGGGVAEGEYVEDSAEVRNWYYVLGHGNKASRVRLGDSGLYANTDSITRFGRIEEVLDAGQEEIGSKVLEQKANDALDERRDMKITARFRLDAIPGQVFGRDFFFDDAVTVYWADVGLAMNDFVSSVTLSLGADESGMTGIQKAEVVVGSEKLAPADGGLLGRYLTGLKRGITNLRA
jgi:hypothetical protein